MLNNIKNQLILLFLLTVFLPAANAASWVLYRQVSTGGGWICTYHPSGFSAANAGWADPIREKIIKSNTLCSGFIED